MATKSTKSEVSNIYKLIIFVLVLIFSFLSGIETVSALRANLFYKSETGELKDTAAFLNALDDNLSKISNESAYMGIGTSLSYEEFIEKYPDAKATADYYDEREKEALSIYEAITELKKLKPETDNNTALTDEYGNPVDNENAVNSEDNGNNNYYSYETDLDFATSAVYNDGNSFKIQSSYSTYDEWSSDYQYLRSKIFAIVSNATNKKTITNELEAKKDSELQSLYTDYVDDRDSYSEFVKSLKNINFLVIDKESGESLRSYDTKEMSDAEFLSTLKKDSIFYISFDGKALTSPTASYDKKSSFLSFLNESSIMRVATVSQDSLTSLFDGKIVYLKVTNAPVKGDGFYNIITTFYTINLKYHNLYTTLSIIFATLSIIIFIVISRFSGKRDDGSIKLTITDKIPFIIHLAATILSLFLLFSLCATLIQIEFEPFSIMGNGINYLLTPSSLRNAFGLCFALIMLVLSSFILYIVRNCKAGTFSRRFIIGLLNAAVSSLKENGAVPESFKALRSKTILVTSTYMLINALYLILGMFTDSAFDSFVLYLMFLIFNAFALIYIVRFISDVLKLTAFADEIKNGNFEQNIDTENFLKPLRSLAVDLSACRDSIHEAVNEAVKGERMKTALITNVSHDLKTPLTSIITYASLLKLCEINNEDAKKYIDVLDEKAKKLQRLIEDLTEASKATTGNVQMNIAVVNLYELALQAAGENSDVLEGAGLDLVISEKGSDIFVSADSQHTFRVIDNLFSNAKKYSLPGSRVYVNVYTENGYGVLSIKNVSKEKLNVAPDELTERFVRGENSRTSEGSGLGLSIARSFTELQNGKFEIEIDGDLFKASVKLPIFIMPEPKPTKTTDDIIKGAGETADFISSTEANTIETAFEDSAEQAEIESSENNPKTI